MNKQQLSWQNSSEIILQNLIVHSQNQPNLIKSEDEDITNFFDDANVINNMLEERKKQVEEKLRYLKSELDFLKELKESPIWLHFKYIFLIVILKSMHTFLLRSRIWTKA